jgi:hypothetical protein
VAVSRGGAETGFCADKPARINIQQAVSKRRSVKDEFTKVLFIADTVCFEGKIAGIGRPGIRN